MIRASLGLGSTRTPGLLGVAGRAVDQFADASSFLTGAELFADGGCTRA